MKKIKQEKKVSRELGRWEILNTIARGGLINRSEVLKEMKLRAMGRLGEDNSRQRQQPVQRP